MLPVYGLDLRLMPVCQCVFCGFFFGISFSNFPCAVDTVPLTAGNEEIPQKNILFDAVLCVLLC